MADLPIPPRRLRVVASLFALYALAGVVVLLGLRPDPRALPAADRGAGPASVAAAAHAAVELHPLGQLLVPYEHRRLEGFVSRFGDGRDVGDDASYIASAIGAYHVQLDEMSLLLAGLFGVAFLAALLALRGAPAGCIVGGVLLLLVVPAPIFSVGPGSVALTLPFLVAGALVLAWRTRAPEPAALPRAPDGSAPPSGPIHGPAESNPGRDVGLGIGLFALAGISGALAAGAGGSGAAKLWVGAVAAFGLGLYLLVTGLIGLGRRRPKG